MENDEIAQSLIGRTITGKNEGDLVLTRVLGTGSFAVVYLADSVNDNKRYAVKCLFKYGLTPSQLVLQRKEVEILEHVRGHRNIIHLYDFVDTDDYLFLVLELCDGDLFDAIERRGGFADATVRDVFAQLIDALAYSHKRGVFHRDIKPENVLVMYEEDEEGEERIIVKLTDFGLATTDVWSTDFGCGSVRYMAPECLGDDTQADNNNNNKKQNINSAVGYRKYNNYDDEEEEEGYAPGPNDVWAMGVMLVNMLTGQNPWVEPSMSDPLYAAYKGEEGDILKVHFGFSGEVDELLAKVFDTEPHRRPSLEELREAVVGVDRFFDVSDFVGDEKVRASTPAPVLIPIPAVATDSAIAVTPARPVPIQKVDLTKSAISWSDEADEMNFDDIPVFDRLPTSEENVSPSVTITATITTATKPVVVAVPTIEVTTAPEEEEETAKEELPSVPTSRLHLPTTTTTVVSTTINNNNSSSTNSSNITSRRRNRRPRNNRRRAPQQGRPRAVNYCATPPPSPALGRRFNAQQQQQVQGCAGAAGIIQCAVMRLTELVGAGRVCVVG
ncbi:hypothetical protein HK097_002857 [Rhizophlyctis rosea]|uniref:Protein kinase domain-containing protein n=1 Tax=Rhizophlyctis rosea TaxID=64517 RepID=A0AAD5S5H7_9FUNG|nr:hypothetical protein HK097_002857 [Rhizophlyctis rosea]